jgi:hypothetical protein
MATPKHKKKGTKGSKGASKPTTDSVVADTPSELAPPVLTPKVPPLPPEVKEVVEPEPLPKVTVAPLLDPTAKVAVTGLVSANFTYGGQDVRLRQGKVSLIPMSAVDHCKRIKYIG